MIGSIRRAGQGHFGIFGAARNPSTGIPSHVTQGLSREGSDLVSFLALFFFSVALVAIGVEILGLGLFLRFLFRDKPPVRSNGPFPGVTVFKPCFLTDDGEAQNYAYFFEQDYPGPWELLFVAARESDPAVPLVRDFIRRYPQVDARLVISEPRTQRAWFGKIDSTYDAVKIAKYDYFIISDSDSHVRRDYARQMVSALQEPGVSLVSTPQWDCGANNFATSLKCLANNADSAVFVLLFDFLRPKEGIALGQSIGFRLSEFNALPEDTWSFIYHFLAEDIAYARVFRRGGKKSVLRNIYCPVWFSGKTLKQVDSQKVRWLLNQKMAAGHPLIYLFGVLLYPEVPALLYLLLAGPTSSALALFGFACGVRVFIAALVEWLYLGSLRMSLRYFWTVPIWDLVQPYYFLRGFFKSRLHIQGRTFRVVDKEFYSEENTQS